MRQSKKDGYLRVNPQQKRTHGTAAPCQCLSYYPSYSGHTRFKRLFPLFSGQCVGIPAYLLGIYVLYLHKSRFWVWAPRQGRHVKVGTESTWIWGQATNSSECEPGSGRFLFSGGTYTSRWLLYYMAACLKRPGLGRSSCPLSSDSC